MQWGWSSGKTHRVVWQLASEGHGEFFLVLGRIRRKGDRGTVTTRRVFVQCWSV